LNRRVCFKESHISLDMTGRAVEIFGNRFVPKQCLQFLNEALWKISPKSPEVALSRSTQKETRSGISASGLVDPQ
jgi:hypothetical protein